jgi:hypothetical protein
LEGRVLDALAGSSAPPACIERVFDRFTAFLAFPHGIVLKEMETRRSTKNEVAPNDLDITKARRQALFHKSKVTNHQSIKHVDRTNDGS